MAQERGPEHFVLRVADVDAEHLPVTVAGHPGGHQDGAGDDPVVDPSLDVGRVQVHVGNATWSRRRLRRIATSSSIPAQILETVDFDTPDSQPNARTKSSTFRVLVPVM
jgi:hypothetical protein